MNRILFAALALAATLAATDALAEQKAQSGSPLKVYCNTVPELDVVRADAVDNWVAICTVWFQYKCRETPPAKDKAAKKEG